MQNKNDYTLSVYENGITKTSTRCLSMKLDLLLMLSFTVVLHLKIINFNLTLQTLVYPSSSLDVHDHVGTLHAQSQMTPVTIYIIYVMQSLDQFTDMPVCPIEQHDLMGSNSRPYGRGWHWNSPGIVASYLTHKANYAISFL